MLIVFGILVETVKKSVLQAQNLLAQAKNDPTDPDLENAKRRIRLIVKNFLLTIQNSIR